MDELWPLRLASRVFFEQIGFCFLFRWFLVPLSEIFLLPYLLPGCGHHSDAGEENASFPVASIWYLWLRVWAWRTLVPTVSDSMCVKLAVGFSEMASHQEMSWDCISLLSRERER